MIKISNLNFQYKDNIIFNNADFSASVGLTVIKGESGGLGKAHYLKYLILI